MTTGFAIFAILIVLYAALAVKLGRWSITMPMVFVAVGFLLGPSGAHLVAISPQTETVKRLTEITRAPSSRPPTRRSACRSSTIRRCLCASGGR
jgi:hypothetical protein